MVALTTAKFHYLLACFAAAMLFGRVSGHFRVGRELFLWHQQPPCPMGSRISPEWFQRNNGDENVNSEEWKVEQM